MLLCKQAEKGVPLQAEQFDWLADTDEEIDEHDIEAHYSYMAKIQEVPTAVSGTDSEPLERDTVPKTNVSEGLSKPVTTQNLPQTARQAVRNTNVIKPGMYQIDTRTTQTRAPQLPQTSKNTNPHVSTSTGVNHITNVSRPKHRSNQMKDKVVPNISQVKFKTTEIED
ncbi:hypothetical protein Tco_1140770 [Tanacetum coccineum]